jgi:cytoskeletal protein CcmA (bactofilin family)
MFGNNKKQAAADKRAQVARDGGVTILTAGCHFAGKLYCKGATRIGGTIEGEIIAEGVLIVELEAVVNGVVKAEEIVVHGRIEGALNVSGRLEICSTADIQAEVTTPNLTIHEGAIFNGRTTMKRPAVSTETASRNGKNTKESKSLKSDTPRIDAEAERPGIKAARVPDISFA